MKQRRSRLLTPGRAYSLRPEKYDRPPEDVYEVRRRHLEAQIPDKVFSGISGSILEPDPVALGEYAPYVSRPAHDAMERGRVAGFNVQRRGKLSIYHPRISRQDYLMLMEKRKPEMIGRIDTLLSCLSKSSVEAKSMFKRIRKVVSAEGGPGLNSFSISPRIVESMDEEDMPEEWDLSPTVLERLRGGLPYVCVRDNRRQVTLQYIFSDAGRDLIERCMVPRRVYEGVKRLSATKPLLAAKSIQNAMNKLQNRVNFTVVSGDYGDSKKHMSRIILQMTANYKKRDIQVFSTITKSTILMHSTSDESDWLVFGPLKYAREVQGIFWMIAEEGIHVPATTFQYELTILGISISNGVTCEIPFIEFNCADSDTRPLEEIGVHSAVVRQYSPSTVEKLRSLKDRVLPVTTRETDQQVASAIRVTSKCVLINAHVVEAEEPLLVNNTPFQCKKHISRDAWAAECTGIAKPWQLRSPIAGERVVIAYRTGQVVSTSAPLRVIKVNGAVIILSQDTDIRRGCSGGAVVALSDQALLGIYSSSTACNLLAYSFTQDDMTELLDSETTVPVPEGLTPEAHAEGVLAQLRQKGLAAYFEAVVESMVPVYHGVRQVGMAVNLGTRFVTTCDATLPLSFGAARVSGPATTLVDKEVYSVALPALTADTPRYFREPRKDEKVFVVGRADDDPFISLSTTIIHVNPDAKSFCIKPILKGEFPIRGGIVMGFDGAVLGHVSAPSVSPTFGIIHVCWPLGVDNNDETPSPRQFLEKRFPFLHTDAWPEPVFEEAFTHSSVGADKVNYHFNVGQKPLAAIGDAAAHWVYHRMLRESGEPHSQWTALVQEKLRPRRCAEIAWDNQLSDNLIVAQGVNCPKDGRIYTDLFLACLGAVSLYERSCVLVKFCVATGLLPDISIDVPDKPIFVFNPP